MVMELCCEKKPVKPSQLMEAYRLWLYGRGQEQRNATEGQVVRVGFAKKEVQETREKKGKAQPSGKCRLTRGYATSPGEQSWAAAVL